MQKSIIQMPAISLVGIKCRTSYAMEMDPALAQIGAMVHRYLSEVKPHINSKNPMVDYAVYTEYESNENGPYTYFIGAEVLDNQQALADGLSIMVIPAQKYAKFTTDAGNLVEKCISAWQEIWKMSDGELGGTRAYIADFEFYDERAIDQHNSVLDLYIGIE